MTITLAQIDELFSRLNDDEQLLLIDHLAERTPYEDELSDGIGKAVWALFRSVGETDEAASEFYPAGSPDRGVWSRYNKRRDATLEGAIRLRNLGRMAA